MTKKRRRSSHQINQYLLATQSTIEAMKKICRMIEKGMELNVDDDDRVIVTRLSF